MRAEQSKKAMAGNKVAFQELVLQEKDNLYRMAYIYMKNENDALDVVHESVFKAYKSIKKLKEPSYFSTWLTRIIINTSIDFLKKKTYMMWSRSITKRFKEI